MNSWLSDPAALQPNNHAGFGPSADPSMAFLQPPATIDPAQFQNQRFVNGAARPASSLAFQNPLYQVNSVVPSKRPREGSLGASPRQAPGALPVSRSQTPGQAQYPPFTSNGASTPQYPNAPTPFQHLQAGATSNTTPSPTVPQMNFGQAGGAPRVATSSPGAFSPHHGGLQMSPAHADQVSRGTTPHEHIAAFPPNNPYAPMGGQPFNPNINGAAGQPPPNPQLGLAQHHLHTGGMTPQQQRAFQIQMQAQARQMQQASVQGRPMNSGMPMPNPQMTAMQQMHPQQVAKPNNPEEFTRQVQQVMASMGRAANMYAVICERRIHAAQVFPIVVKLGTSARVSKMGQWPAIAQQLHFPPHQIHQAGQELQAYWVANMAPYEAYWVNKRRAQPQGPGTQSGVPNQMQTQMSPARQGIPGPEQATPNHPRNAPDASTAKADPNAFQQSPMNGFIPPARPAEQASHRQHVLAQQKTNVGRQLQPPQANGLPAPFPTEPPAKRRDPGASRDAQRDTGPQMPAKVPLEDQFTPAVLPESRHHGPIITDDMIPLCHSLLEGRPTVPTFRELGVVDVHALTMSIKSGIRAEVRVALDTLTTLSVEQGLQLSLDHCDDLVEALIDCAQTQVDFLAEHAAEVSDEMLIASYEDVVRGFRMETLTLQDVPEFGSLDYDLDRAVDRLICITTLLRNYSFYESNFTALGLPEVVRFLTGVIRRLGTKEMLLRTHRNTLDFMKDVIVYLSNLSHSIQLPGKEEALCLLHFLLAFAPSPPPISPSSSKITFAMYNPNIHKYTPSAVDSLAKLLARDEPNRTYYRAIFAADAASSPPYDLLTRAFGLAISPLPVTMVSPRAVVGARKPFLLQGMLAAEILSGIVPGANHGLARSWLESVDGFAASLLRLVCLLSSERPNNAHLRHPQGGRLPHDPDADAYGAIVHRGMAVLKRLVEKARSGDSGELQLPPGVLPKKESLLGALIMKDIDPFVLRQLCAYSALED